jgi:hypothetical protein
MTSGAGMPKLLIPLRNLLFAAPTKGANYLYQAAFDESHAGQSGIYLSGNKVKPLKLKLTEEELKLLTDRIIPDS